MSADLFNQLDPELQQIILDGPALKPPKGVIPEFDHPSNKNDVAFAIITASLVLSSAVMLLRVYSMAFVARKVHIEDVLAVAAFGTFIGFSYCGYRLIAGTGIFVHQWDIRIRDMSDFLYFVNVASSFYIVTVGCLKAAILLEWLRIFIPHRTSNVTTTVFRYTSYAVLTINTLFYAAVLIAGNLSCIPQAKIWNPLLPGKCIDRKKLDTANAGINVLSTVFILCLPQGVIWSLQMTKKMKMKVSMVFAVGLLYVDSPFQIPETPSLLIVRSAVTAAGARLATTVQYLRSDDTTFFISGMALSCVAEQTCAFVVFCVPCIPNIFRQASKVPKSSAAQNLFATSSTSEPKSGNTPKIGTYEPPMETRRNNSESKVPLSERAATVGFAFSSIEEQRRHYEGSKRASYIPLGHGRGTSLVADDDEITPQKDFSRDR
ncbi:hypothetical protein HJFPF1_08299 [Paramyrothecium foliicola]|nr:hypothetical protein HJFPF1_08299 [Paramyrothecium foliicola]